MVWVPIVKIQEKGASLGRTQVVVLCLELGFVWLVYVLFGLVAYYDMPVWLTAMMVVIVDRLVSAITTQAQRKREALSKDRAGSA